MKGILADNNIERHLWVLALVLDGDYWRDVWEYLQLSLFTYRDLGLEQDISDATLWNLCQKENLLLLTANRNADGPESLEETMRVHGRPESLPVFTLGNSERVLNSREYAGRVVDRLMEYLVDIDKYRGTGRLYLP